MTSPIVVIVITAAMALTVPSVNGQTELRPILPNSLLNYANPPLPAHFSLNGIRNADTTPNDNPTSDAGATLGRVLFYDKMLSQDNSTSCASCHAQSRGFSDQDRLSTGFSGGLTARHSMGLSNARYYEPNRFFWDERAASLEEQVLQPIQDAVEMGETLNNVVEKLSATDYYPPLFERAFGSRDINSQRIANSLAQFIRAMVSYRSKYDQGVAINFSNFTAQEEQGRQLFNSRQTNCRSCHNTDLQLMDQARNNGLDAANADNGVGNGRFKSPSLRNVSVRAPFMHDGRFSSLEQVVDFYNSGIQDNPNLDNRLSRNGQPIRMGLDAEERAALVAFLGTLTDNEFLSDSAFSDPFQLVESELPNTGELSRPLAIAAILALLLSEDSSN
ncbi:cytochrome c peroxidase [Arenicella sp. 4NH20-0111]|uniref:cytochrome-c peroxidase n=1 Tax=Arenicella sp. 4NH20-0111 TaxID=3127648 RepID=UPI003107ADC2